MKREKIIEFESVTIEARPPFDAGLRALSFAIGAGELMAVCVEEGYGHTPLADAAQGVIEPSGGRIMICGEEWRSLSPARMAEMRGRIGRVYEEHGWVSNLDMDENITLSQRHHTLRPEEEIVAEATALSRRFGFEGLPVGRAGALKRADRRRAEWVRAFLGEPMLIVLEHPMRDVYEEALAGLLGEIRAAKERGAGVLWITSDESMWPPACTVATHRLKQKGADWIPVERM